MGRALVGPDADGSFGASLALSAEGTRLAVGAPNVPHDPSAAAGQRRRSDGDGDFATGFRPRLGEPDLSCTALQ